MKNIHKFARRSIETNVFVYLPNDQQIVNENRFDYLPPPPPPQHIKITYRQRSIRIEDWFGRREDNIC